MNKQASQIRIVIFAAALAATALLAILLMWTRHSAVEATQFAQRVRNLKTLYVALAHYSDEHDGLPPASSTDRLARPAHSWRVLLLPFLDRESLYTAINLDEPWDSPANQRLLNAMPEYYRSPVVKDAHSTQTNYIAVTGPHAPWWFGKTKKPPTSSESEAIMLIELPGSTTPWMDPYDPTLEQLLDTLQSQNGTSANGFETTALMYITVHGEVKTLPLKTDRDTLRRLFLGTLGKPLTEKSEEGTHSR